MVEVEQHTIKQLPDNQGWNCTTRGTHHLSAWFAFKSLEVYCREQKVSAQISWHTCSSEGAREARKLGSSIRLEDIGPADRHRKKRW